MATTINIMGISLALALATHPALGAGEASARGVCGNGGEKGSATVTVAVLPIESAADGTTAGDSSKPSKLVYRTCDVAPYWDGFSVTDQERHFILKNSFELGAFSFKNRPNTTDNKSFAKAATAAIHKAIKGKVATDSLSMTKAEWFAPKAKWQQWNKAGRWVNPDSVFIDAKLVDARPITRLRWVDGKRVAVIHTTLSRQRLGIEDVAGFGRRLGEKVTIEVTAPLGQLEER